MLRHPIRIMTVSSVKQMIIFNDWWCLDGHNFLLVMQIYSRKTPSIWIMGQRCFCFVSKRKVTFMDGCRLQCWSCATHFPLIHRLDTHFTSTEIAQNYGFGLCDRCWFLLKSDASFFWASSETQNRKLEVNHSEIDSRRFALSLETVEFNVSKWNSRVSSPRGLSLYLRLFLLNETKNDGYQSVGENLCCTTINNWITFNLSDKVFILHASNFLLLARDRLNEAAGLRVRAKFRELAKINNDGLIR